MMKNMHKNHLAFAVATAVGLVASTAQAVDYSASATLENTLTVVNLLDFSLGTVFAATTGAALINGVGALVISPTGTVTDPTDSATVNLISLTTPVPAQGSVAMNSTFTLTLPNTALTLAADFAADAGASLVTITDGTGNATELVHSSANPAVPSLWLTHFKVGDVSGGVGTQGVVNSGSYSIVPNFGETSYVFNIGATLTTEPTTSALNYQAGVYSGTFTVTAAY